MRYVRRVPLFILALTLLGGCVLSGHPVSPHGRNASVFPRGESRVRGELIAATRDTVWLLADSALMPFRMASLRGVNVDRHRMGFGRTLTWASIAGAATATAMLYSCHLYASSSDGSGSSCSGVFPGTFVFFAVAGGLLGLLNEHSSKHHLSPERFDRLPPYARFPQGMPDSLRRLLPLGTRQP